MSTPSDPDYPPLLHEQRIALRAYAAERQYTNENVDIQFGTVVQGSLLAGLYYTPPPHPVGFRADSE